MQEDELDKPGRTDTVLHMSTMSGTVPRYWSEKVDVEEVMRSWISEMAIKLSLVSIGTQSW